MRGENQNGFTIIETTIFLAVSALLFVSVLVGTSTAVARQRYADSVRSTEGFLQQQIDKTFNFSNSRNGSQVCTAAGISSGTQSAGTSNCIVLGKALRFYPNSSLVTIYNVIGAEPSNVVSNGSFGSYPDETALLDAYQPRAVMNVEVETYEAPWEARFTGAGQSQGGGLSPLPINTVLFLRSPRSGGLLVYTVVWPNLAPANGTVSLVGPTDSSRLQKQASFCMRSQDFTAANMITEIQLTGQGGQSAVRAIFDGANAGACTTIP